MPGAKHRDAWAEETTAPEEALAEPPPMRRIVTTMTSEPLRGPNPAADEGESDVLVVVSKIKKHISDRSGMSTSQTVMDVLSKHLRMILDRSIQEAQAHGRKTVLERDMEEAVRKFGRSP